LEEGFEAWSKAFALFSGIAETQVGELRTHGADGFFHLATSDGLAATRELPAAESEGVDEKVVHRELVFDVAEEGVDAERLAVSCPGGEVAVAPGDGLRYDAGAERCMCIAEVSAESIAGSGCHMRQGWP
jgi:hypothetical protein